MRMFLSNLKDDDTAKIIEDRVNARLTEVLGSSFFKKQEETKKEEPKKEESTLDKAKADFENQSKTDAQLKEVEDATRFELTFPTLKENYKNYLPKETDNIMSIVDSQKFNNTSEKVREKRVNLMDAFFAEQKNIDVLNDTMKNKVNKYQALTQDAKRSESNKYWEVFEIALDNLKTADKVRQAQKANGTTMSDEDEVATYSKKIFDKGFATYLGANK